VVATLLLIGNSLQGQGVIKGEVIDDNSGETLIGAAVVIKGTTIGATTDIDGKFEIQTDRNPPLTLTISFMGYESQEYQVTDFNQKVKITLGTNKVLMKEVEIVGSRISEKTKQAPLTVESMDVIAIKQAPSGNFYESLGNLKGVDITSASLGFKIINTRGFNSTSPVRSLQLIDGVDNQSPGLNFSLGNLLGASDLDVKGVEIVAGASSAYYGPGAFNGVISMTTKDPFLFPGLTASLKLGERDLFEGAVRWAQVIKNKEGVDKFGYKLNVFYLSANDWEATNYEAVDDLPEASNYYSGINAVNIYGDEVETGGNNYSNEPTGYNNTPALTRIYRSGYREEDLADYDTRNLKTNLGLYYKLKDDVVIDYYFNYGTATSIYQGDNRYSLKGIEFFQQKIQIEKKDKFFLRAYSTREDAGESYDAVLTGNLMQDTYMDEGTFYRTYAQNYELFNDSLFLSGMPDSQSEEYQATRPQASDFQNPDGSFDSAGFTAAQNIWRQSIRDAQAIWANDNPGVMTNYNAMIRRITEGQGDDPYFEPGTARYDSLLNVITSNLLNQGGSRLYDKSSLYQVQGEYNFDVTEMGKLTVGASARWYRPESNGTIFEDSVSVIKNSEAGAYAGYEHKFLSEALTARATIRVDKNRNFDAVYSPAISLVYTLSEKTVLRGGFSSAVRNPTLADQYLYYNVGQAILLGNLNGIDSLVTIDSFNAARNRTSFAWEELDFYDVAPIRPEQARTFEVGVRSSLTDKIYIDANYYYTRYIDFIGFNIGVQFPYTPQSIIPTNIQAYRVAANATDVVTTQGFALGVNYYFIKNFALTGNFSWNKLISGDDDPIIPAFNTPEFKYNIGMNARDLDTDFGFFRLKNWGFAANFKWVEGFVFEGSPQFTGFVDSYYMVDAAVTSNFKKINTTVKLGASNLTNNEVYTVYGGPLIGRMAYVSLVYEFINR
jgi:outer membrane receptor protein involved in Fe transport